MKTGIEVKRIRDLICRGSREGDRIDGEDN